MRAGFGVDALLGKAETLHGTAANEVFFDDDGSVFRLDVAVPHGFRVDDNRGAVFALVEAAGLVDAHAAGEAGGLSELLQLRVQLALAIGGAGWARRIGGALIVTDEDVTFK